VNATQVEGVKYELASDFIQWLIDSDAQELIGSYGQADYGQSIFMPATSVLQTQSPSDIFNWIRDNAFFDFNGTLYECPPPWRSDGYSPIIPVLMLKMEQIVREIER
jgi:hypothetical protein